MSIPLPVIIGADPDMKQPSLAVIDYKSGKVLAVRVIKVAEKKTEWEGVVECVKAIRGCYRSLLQDLHEPTVLAACIEGQECSYSARVGANPRSIMFLANVAGALLGEAGYECGNLFFPSPNDWKGSVPKQIHQSRVLSSLGWDFEKVGSADRGYARPTQELPTVMGSGEVTKGQWKHLVDAIGLGLWARNYMMGQKHADR